MVFRFYQWETYNRPVDANIAGKAMEKIIDEQGTLTKENFLEYSRPVDSDTHALFDWDDSVAAEKWRLKQSGDCITHISIRYENDGKEDNAPAFVNVQVSHEKGQYKPIAVAFNNADDRKAVIKRAMNELNTFQYKYKSYKEFSKIFADIDNLKLQIKV